MNDYININKYKHTPYTDGPLDVSSAEIAKHIESEVDRSKRAREVKSTRWEYCWGAYVSSPESLLAERKATEITGDTNKDWRHKIQTAKGFELIETAVSYYMSAFFPNSDWYDLTPDNSKFADLAKIIKKYIGIKLAEGKFEYFWELNVRQTAIVGTSAIALPWREETTTQVNRKVNRTISGEIDSFEEEEVEETSYEGIDFSIINTFDLFLPPEAKDPNNCNLIRKIKKTKADVIQGINEGLYDISKDKIISGSYKPIEESKNMVRSFQGMSDERAYNPLEEVELYEFWGDLYLNDCCIHNVLATTMDGVLIRIERNPYYCGKPFIVTRYTPINDTPYGLSLLDPVIGLIHEQNSMTNHRLDCQEIALNPMFTLKDDGGLDTEDIASEPGKVYPVREHNCLQTIQMPTNFTISISEQQLQEQMIDQITGLVGAVGMSGVRNAERVTAEEVQQVRASGGQRLAQVHRHMEKQALLPLVNKVFHMMRQFTSKDEVVKVIGLTNAISPTTGGPATPGEEVQMKLKPEAFSLKFDIQVKGASHIADKEVAFQSLLNFIDIVGNRPAMAAHINWEALLREVAGMSNIEDVDKYIQKNIGISTEIEQQAFAAAEQAKLAPAPPPPPQPSEQEMAMAMMSPDMQPQSAIEQQAYLEGGAPGVMSEKLKAPMPMV